MLTNEIINILVNSLTFLIFILFQDIESIPCRIKLIVNAQVTISNSSKY